MKLICTCGADVYEATEVIENPNSKRLSYTKTYVIKCNACNKTFINDSSRSVQKFLKLVLEHGFRIGFI